MRATGFVIRCDAKLIGLAQVAFEHSENNKRTLTHTHNNQTVGAVVDSKDPRPCVLTTKQSHPVVVGVSLLLTLLSSLSDTSVP